MKKNISFLLLVLLFTAFVNAEPQMNVDIYGYDFSNKEQLLEFAKDSRNVRELKFAEGSKAEAQKKAYNEAMQKIYNSANEAANQSLRHNPRFQGKETSHWEFSTPEKPDPSGKPKKTKVNTDYDVRRGFYEVPGDKKSHFVEVETKHWEKPFLKNFARNTGFEGNINDLNALKQHAEQFRVLPTDRMSTEAPIDFSDQKSHINEQYDGRTNFNDVKDGKTTLKSESSFAETFNEKFDEQYRQAEAERAKLNDPNLTPEQRRKIKQKAAMHDSEALAQFKKTMQNLNDVRDSYKNQGYDVGEIPEKLKKVLELDSLKNFQGKASDDLNGLKLDLAKNGMDIDGLNRATTAQIEALKFSQNNPPSVPSTSPGNKSFKLTPPGKMNGKIMGAGNVLGVVGDVTSIIGETDDALNNRNAHTWNNIYSDDDALTVAGKEALIMAGELGPVSLSDCMDRGEKVENEIRAIIEQRIKEGKPPLSDAELAMLVAGKSLSNAAEQLVLGNIKNILDAEIEAGKLLSDGISNWLQAGDNEIDDANNEAKKKAFEARNKVFNLGDIDIYRVNGDFAPVTVNAGEVLVFKTDKQESWNGKTYAKWELISSAGNRVLKTALTSDSGANECSLHTTEDFSGNNHTIKLSIWQNDGNLFVDSRESQFCVRKVGFNLSYIAAIDKTNKKMLASPVDKDVQMIFEVVRTPQWKEQTIEWLINGVSCKSLNASDGSSNSLKWSTTGEKPGTYKVSVRAIEDGKIVAYQSYTYTVKGKEKEKNIIEPPDPIDEIVYDAPNSSGEDQDESSEEEPELQDAPKDETEDPSFNGIKIDNSGNDDEEETTSQSQESTPDKPNGGGLTVTNIGGNEYEITGGDYEWEGWDEEADDTTPQTYDSGNYGGTVFVPDAGEVNSIIGKVAINEGSANSTVNNSNVTGSANIADIQQGMADTHAKQEEERESMMNEHEKAMGIITGGNQGGSTSTGGRYSSSGGNNGIQTYDPNPWDNDEPSFNGIEKTNNGGYSSSFDDNVCRPLYKEYKALDDADTKVSQRQTNARNAKENFDENYKNYYQQKERLKKALDACEDKYDSHFAEECKPVKDNYWKISNFISAEYKKVYQEDKEAWEAFHAYDRNPLGKLRKKLYYHSCDEKYDF